MAIRPHCNKCKKELDNFGAILFGPPDSKDVVKKFHLCKKCYLKMIKGFK